MPTFYFIKTVKYKKYYYFIKERHFNSKGNPLTELTEQQTHCILISLRNSKEKYQDQQAAYESEFGKISKFLINISLQTFQVF